MTPHHRSQCPIGTHIQQPEKQPITITGKHITVTSPALERWQVALILGVSERTVQNWEKSILTTFRKGGIVRYPAFENGLSSFIEIVSNPKDATPRPVKQKPRLIK